MDLRAVRDVAATWDGTPAKTTENLRVLTDGAAGVADAFADVDRQLADAAGWRRRGRPTRPGGWNPLGRATDAAPVGLVLAGQGSRPDGPRPDTVTATKEAP